MCGLFARLQRIKHCLWDLLVTTSVSRPNTFFLVRFSQWRNQGRFPGGPAPPYFSTKMRKKFFWRPPPPLISGSGWPPPPSPLIWRSGSATGSKGEAHVFLTSMLLWRTSPPQYLQASALLIQFFVLCWSRCLLSTDSPHAWHCSSPYWQISSCFCTNDRSQLVSKKNREQ